MYKIKFQNFRLFAEKIEIKYPTHDFDNKKSLEYDIYAHGLRLGTTTNRVLNFRHILENAYDLEKNWRAEVKERKERGSVVMPECKLSQGQLLMIAANDCPDVEEPLGEKTYGCWSRLNVGRLKE